MRFIILIMIILGFGTLQAQEFRTDTDSPLNPVGKPENFLGAYIGVGQNFQSGKFYVECNDCIFEGAVGAGFSIGALFEKPLGSYMRYGISAGLDITGIEGSFIEYESMPYRQTPDSPEEDIIYQFRHTADAGFTFLNTMPYLKFYPFKYMFIKFGSAFSYGISSSIVHQKHLLNRTALLRNGTILDLSIEGSPDPYVITVEDGEFTGFEPFQVFLVPAIGAVIPLDDSDEITLSPYFQFGIPVTKYSDVQDGFIVNTWRIMAELTFSL
jgi:hypothetical protein